MLREERLSLFLESLVQEDGKYDYEKKFRG